MRHIQTMTGKGTVTADSGEQVPVDYELHVLQEEICAGRGSPPIPGRRDVSGVILPVRLPLGDPLLLEMQDGRKLRFLFTDMHGSIALSEWLG